MPKNYLTKAEFYAKYGELPLQFSRYTQYTFFYEGIMDDVKVEAAIGGKAKEIRRMDVRAGETIIPNNHAHQKITAKGFDGEILYEEEMGMELDFRSEA